MSSESTHMHRRCRGRAALGVFFSAGILAASPTGPALASEGAESPLVRAAQALRFEQRPGESVPMDVPLVDERGRQTSLAELAQGRPVVLALIYFKCPMLCNEVLNGLARCLKGTSLRAGRDFAVAAVSFDERDTPELAHAKKASYATQHGEDIVDAWQFLTGNGDDVRRIAQSVGFKYEFDPTTGEFRHAAGLVVITPDGRVSRYLFGIEYAPRDLRLAVVEAADGKVGSVGDQLLLLCMQYDPATGKYGLLVMRFVQIGGILTVGGIVGLMYSASRHRTSALSSAQASVDSASGGEEGE